MRLARGTAAPTSRQSRLDRWAQINGGKLVDVGENALDEWYVQNALRLDAEIVWRTFCVVLQGIEASHVAAVIERGLNATRG